MAIKPYVHIGGLPDDPQMDTQDRSWFGPHDQLFTEEEYKPVDFLPGPEYSMSFICTMSSYSVLIFFMVSVVLGLG